MINKTMAVFVILTDPGMRFVDQILKFRTSKKHVQSQVCSVSRIRLYIDHSLADFSLALTGNSFQLKLNCPFFNYKSSESLKFSQQIEWTI